MNRMYNPPHPGETLRDDVLPALGLSVTDAARELGVTRATLSRVLNGHAMSCTSTSQDAQRISASRGRAEF